MNRTYVDCDQEIERRAGMSIPEIFEKQGEAGFRDIEAQVVADVCREKSRVIALGGGAVLRPENVRAMRQNGVVVMVERELERLSMDGRPLSKSLEALREMWQARQPLYRAAADIAIDNNQNPDQAARAAQEAFYEAAHR